MALTKVSTGLISADLASVDLNIDANTLYIDVTNNRVGINNTGPATALDVTGTVTADGLTVDADGNTNPVVLTHSNTGPTLRFENTDQTTSDGQQLSRIEFSTDDAGTERDQIYLQMTGNGAGGAANFDVMTGNGTPVKRASFDVGGDISFYEDTGTNAKFFWDSSAESLGIGTTTPDNKLHVVSGAAGEVAQFTGAIEARGLSIRSETNTDASAHVVFNSQSGGSKGMFTFETDGTERLRIDSSGSVGIGSTAPQSQLESKQSDSQIYSGTSVTSSDYGLHVTRRNSGGADGEFAGIKLSATGNEGVTTGIVTLEVIQPAAAASSGELAIKTRNAGVFSEAMRIDSSGNVITGSDTANNADAVTLRQDGTVHANNLQVANAGGSVGGTTPAIYSPASSTLAISTNSNERLRVDNVGNVGIGTTSPVAPLTIGGTSQVSFIDSAQGGITTNEAAGVTASVTGYALKYRQNVGSGFHAWETSGNTTAGGALTYTEAMRIDSIGRVGIGTSSPGTFLHIQASSGGSGFWLDSSETSDQTNRFVSLHSSGGTYSTLAIDAGQHLFRIGTSEAARIDSSGNLLVGKGALAIGTAGIEARASGQLLATADGDNPVDFNRKTSDGNIALFRKDGATVGSIGVISSTMHVGTSDCRLRFNSAASDIRPVFSTGLNYDAAIDLGDSAARFKDLYLSGDIYLNNTNKSSIPTGVLSLIFNTNDASSPNLISGGYGGSHNHQQFYHASTAVGSIVTTSSATAYNTSSDYRLKENVVAMSGATERLKQLKPSRFNFIADPDTTVDGFLAHEVQDIVPEAITGTKDAVDAEGNPEYQNIDQSKLVPLLVATIQELEARIAALEGAN